MEHFGSKFEIYFNNCPRRACRAADSICEYFSFNVGGFFLFFLLSTTSLMLTDVSFQLHLNLVLLKYLTAYWGNT